MNAKELKAKLRILQRLEGLENRRATALLNATHRVHRKYDEQRMQVLRDASDDLIHSLATDDAQQAFIRRGQGQLTEGPSGQEDEPEEVDAVEVE